MLEELTEINQSKMSKTVGTRFDNWFDGNNNNGEVEGGLQKKERAKRKSIGKAEDDLVNLGILSYNVLKT